MTVGFGCGLQAALRYPAWLLDYARGSDGAYQSRARKQAPASKLGDRGFPALARGLVNRFHYSHVVQPFKAAWFGIMLLPDAIGKGVKLEGKFVH